MSPPFLKPQCEDVSWTYCIVPVNSDVLALHDEQKQGSQYTIWCFLIRRWVGVIMRGRLASNRLRVGYRAELATLTHFSVFSCTPAVSAKGKTKVSWLISFHSLIRQCFNILIQHCNPLVMHQKHQNRTIKTTISQQYTSFVFTFAKTMSVGVTSVDRENARTWHNSSVSIFC